MILTGFTIGIRAIEAIQRLGLISIRFKNLIFYWFDLLKCVCRSVHRLFLKIPWKITDFGSVWFQSRCLLKSRDIGSTDSKITKSLNFGNCWKIGIASKQSLSLSVLQVPTRNLPVTAHHGLVATRNQPWFRFISPSYDSQPAFWSSLATTVSAHPVLLRLATILVTTRIQVWPDSQPSTITTRKHLITTRNHLITTRTFHSQPSYDSQRQIETDFWTVDLDLIKSIN